MTAPGLYSNVCSLPYSRLSFLSHQEQHQLPSRRVFRLLPEKPNSQYRGAIWPHIFYYHRNTNAARRE